MMAEAAAEAAITFAVQKLGEAIIQKAVFLKGVKGNVQWVKVELLQMKAFLKDADKKQANESIRTWISDLREVAYDAEDVIDTYILKVDRGGRTRRLVSKCACFPKHLYSLYAVGQEIKSVRQRLEDIDERRERYGININKDDDRVESSIRRSLENIERRRRFDFSNTHLVGLNAKVNMLLENSILENSYGLSLAAIFGMGGIGKSTLARAIYDHSDVVARFDCRAWVVASNEFSPQETMKQLIQELQKSEEDKEKVTKDLNELENSTGDKLYFEQMLHDKLRRLLQGKQYFIVVDDLWERSHWASLKSVFPNENDKASRLLLTSRNSIMKKGDGYVHDMRLLDDDESRELLFKTAFIGNIPEPVESDLENVGREILRKCGGLPLAISVAGGLLMEMEQSKSGWEKVVKEMKSLLDRSDGSESSTVLPILELSYNNLPRKLKACFLCLGFFKEDVAIRKQKLVLIWVSQGIVPQEGVKTMEEVAEGYLDQLINRNLVQIDEDLIEDDEKKTCRVHDLVRDLSIIKAKEEMSFEILMKNSQSTLPTPRHRVIYCSGESFTSSDTSQKNKHIRSLFVHGAAEEFGRSCYWKSFELLKILDFEGFPLKKLPNAIGKLIGLKYLGLRYTRIKKLPSSLGNLIKLEVLDLEELDVRATNVIWKMCSLRHLYLNFFGLGVFCMSQKMRNLRNIQTLRYITLTEFNVEGITELTNLRRLGVILMDDIAPLDESRVFTSLSKLHDLFHLSIRNISDHHPLNIEGLRSLHSVTQLYLRGRMTGFASISNFPPNLSHLTLFGSDFDENPIPILEKLPKLVHLNLYYGAYTDEVMVISNDGFRNLKLLRLHDLSRLRNIEIGEGALPELQRLDIDECRNLRESFREEVRQVLSKLQQLNISR